MLNIGMTELLCFAIIALLILGPDNFLKAHVLLQNGMAKLKNSLVMFKMKLT